MRHGAVHLNNISVAYDRLIAVQGVTGSFEPGSLTAIAGPNGAGKSTLLRAVMGEVRPSSGSIDRQTVKGSKVGYLPQAAEIDRHFPLSVADTVMLGTWGQTGPFGGVSRQAAERGRQALSAVGLDGLERRHIGTLSAGQFQRVLFARLLLQDADIIMLDEPFTAIDAATTRDLLAIIKHWHDGGRTVIAVLHDFEQIRANFPQTLLLARNLVSWGPTGIALSPENVLRAKTMAESLHGHAPAQGAVA
jgi:zinc/manganese transport system ATP-binding protein